MKYKVGDKVKVVSNDSGSDYVGQVYTVISVRDRDYDDQKYFYDLGEAGRWWADHELSLIKSEENKVSKKYYKVTQDTPAWKKGAILEQQDNGDYKAINDLWDNVEGLSDSYVESDKVVEGASEFYERVYAMGKAQKMVFVTKEKAQEMASKFFTGE